jgi:hypothetical protein
VQAPQLGPRLEAHLLDQHRPRLAVGLQRVGLAAGAVQREHPLRVQALLERMRGDEPLELGDRLAVASGRERRVDRQLARPQPELLEAADLRAGERLVGEVAQRLAAPQLERVMRGGGAVAGGLLDEPLEADRVDGVGADAQLVAAAAGDDLGLGALEQPAQLRDVELHHLHAAGGRVLAPEPLDQLVGRHRGVGPQPQHREHRALLRASERQRAAVAGGFGVTQQADPDGR